MDIKRHGLSVGFERIENNIYFTLKAVGKLTHADYETIVPMLESAMESVKHPNVKVLIDGTELEGWELRAAWDDFKLGLKHGNDFDKIAIYGNKGWQEIAARVGSWFTSGEVRYFDNIETAVSWLNEN
jgi:hypothetical protein